MTAVPQRHPAERRLHVAEPCQADWTAMTGDAERRFCGQCQKHVHDLSAMTAPQADAVLASGDVCVRFRQDAEGRVVHRASTSRLAQLLALGVALVAPGLAAAAPMMAPADPPIAEAQAPGVIERMRARLLELIGEAPESVVSQGQVVVMGEPMPEPPPPPPRPEIMGKIAPRPPAPPPPPVVTPPLPTPDPGETVIPEVEDALRRQ